MEGFVAPHPRLGWPRLSLRAPSDERLVAQVRGGDAGTARTAFEALYDRHHRGILVFCRHMLGSPEEAEDAVQHTFSAAYRALVRDDRAISLRAWLYVIARNHCLSVLAARRDQVALDDVQGLLTSTTGLALEVERRSDLRDLLADLQRLPEDQRAALVLAELEAHSHAEIAQILGIAPSKVKALVFQARETLMIRRQARETDCMAIREQLSVLRGGALRRRELRRHVELCEGCRLFEAEVRSQRANMALLLPVAPTLALKHGSLAAAFSAGAAGAGAAGAGGGAVAAGGLVVGVKAISAKVLATLAVAGSAGGGGYVAVNEVTQPGRRSAPAKALPAQSAAPRAVRAAPAAISPGVAATAAAGDGAGDEGRRARGRDRASGPARERGPGAIAGSALPEPDSRGRGGAGPRERRRPRGQGDRDPGRGRGRGRGNDRVRTVDGARSPGSGRGSVPGPDGGRDRERLVDRLGPQSSAREQQRPVRPAPPTQPQLPQAPQRGGGGGRQRSPSAGPRNSGLGVSGD